MKSSLAGAEPNRGGSAVGLTPASGWSTEKVIKTQGVNDPVCVCVIVEGAINRMFSILLGSFGDSHGDSMLEH